MIKIKTIHHVNVPSREESLGAMHEFYSTVFGMSDLERPSDQIGRPGLWMHYGDKELHVSMPGRTPHVALEIENYDEAKQILAEKGIKFQESTRIGQQLFIEDPEGNFIELRPAD